MKRIKWERLLLFFAYIIYVWYPLNSFTTYTTYIPTIKQSVLPFALLFVIIAALITYSKVARNYKVKEKKWLYIILIFILIMLANGFLNDNPIEFLYIDMDGLMLLLCGIVLGMDKDLFKVLLNRYVWILAFGLFFSVISLNYLSSLDRSYTEASLLNKLQVLLTSMYFFIFLINYFENKKINSFLIITLIFFFMEQIIFQKRFPFFRVILSFLLFAYILNKYSGKNLWHLTLRLNKVVLALILLLIPIIVISLLGGYDLFYSMNSFYNRAIQAGSVWDTIVYDGRYQIAGAVISKIFNSDFFLIGQGFGGYLVDPGLWWTISLPQYSLSNAAYTIEIGQTWPLWKGGLIFWFFINIFFLRIIFKLKNYQHDRLKLACWAFITTHFISLFGENFWTNPHQIYIILLGACIGYLLPEKTQRALG